MNVVKEIERINARELNRAIDGGGSWHDEYKESAYVFIGGLDYEYSEGDVICVFSQFGEVVDVNLVRDKGTGKSKGFCFLAYEDQRSTVLAVDNLNGAKLAGRTVRVDHVREYKVPGKKKDKDGNPIEDEEEKTPKPRIAPLGILPGDEELIAQGGADSGSDLDPNDPALKGLDPEDPMYDFIVEKLKKKKRKEREKHKKDKKGSKDGDKKKDREVKPSRSTSPPRRPTVREWDVGKPPRSPSPERRGEPPRDKRDGGDRREGGYRERGSYPRSPRVMDSHTGRRDDRDPRRRSERDYVKRERSRSRSRDHSRAPDRRRSRWYS